MKELELFLHGIGPDNLKLVRVDEDASIADVLKIAENAGLLSGMSVESCEIFFEENDAPADKSHRLRQLGIKHRSHLVCHHCKKIEVSVFYNESKAERFSPTTKVGHVLRWAIKAFGLSGDTTKDMVLRLEGSNDDLPNDARLGSLVKYPHCHLKLILVVHVLVEG